MSLPHDHSEEPEILPWQMGEDISRPEPAASARAYLPPLETSGVLVPSAIVPPYSLYSKEATQPPPPPWPSTPHYFPLIYPNDLRQNRKRQIARTGGILLISMIGSVLLMSCLGFLAFRNGVFNHFFASSTTFQSGKQVTPTQGKSGVGTTTTRTPGVATTVTPLLQTTSTPRITGTTTPLSATPTIHPSMTPILTNTPIPPPSVAITCLFAQDHQQATLCVQTAANATLTIKVLDCDGQLDNNAPTTSIADNTGFFTATWQPRKPGGGCRTATVTVIAMLNGQQNQTQATLTLG